MYMYRVFPTTTEFNLLKCPRSKNSSAFARFASRNTSLYRAFPSCICLCRFAFSLYSSSVIVSTSSSPFSVYAPRYRSLVSPLFACAIRSCPAVSCPFASLLQQRPVIVPCFSCVTDHGGGGRTALSLPCTLLVFKNAIRPFIAKCRTFSDSVETPRIPAVSLTFALAWI